MPVYPPILAHGALGVFDEVLLIGVVIAFVVIMAVSYLRSRGSFEAESAPLSPSEPAPQEADAPDRYRLD
jgi:H+/gluconate symporter-like permease